MKVCIKFYNDGRTVFFDKDKLVSEIIDNIQRLFSIKGKIHVNVLEDKNIQEDPKYLLSVSLSDTQLSRNNGSLLVELKHNVANMLEESGIKVDRSRIQIVVLKGSEDDMNNNQGNEDLADEYNYLKKSKQFIPSDPIYSFDRVIINKGVLEKIEEAVALLKYNDKVFNEWGLSNIMPNPSKALSFYGPSGTGKTMAAEAIAQKLGKKIIRVSYADVESKYHGEGPKMVKAIFLAAENNDAVLFFDEADSLLSKRLTNVSQGSEQAINSMRSQLLICLEDYKGIVIFATNLVVNYDTAFLTRLISIEFTRPDTETRKKIWEVHLLPEKCKGLCIPLSEDIDIDFLAEEYDFVGREIRNAVVSACVKVAMDNRDHVEQSDLINSCNRIINEKKSLEAEKGGLQEIIKEKLIQKINEKKEQMKGEESNVSADA